MSGQLHALTSLAPWKDLLPNIHWIGGWVGPRTSMDDVERRKILPMPGLELGHLGRSARKPVAIPTTLFQLTFTYLHLIQSILQ
jgi:hypothetical protein